MNIFLIFLCAFHFLTLSQAAIWNHAESSKIELFEAGRNLKLITSENEKDDLGAPLGPDDYAAAEMLGDSRFNFDSKVNPITDGIHFQGDIVLSSFDKERMEKSAKGDNDRNVIKNETYKWTNAEIPYTISSEYNTDQRAVIASAFAEYHDKSCIKFVPRVYQSDYIHLYKGSGCYSSVGKSGSQQDVSLGDGCVDKGTIMHELLHAAGFWHEQSRPDRYDYVTIHWGNIHDYAQSNFYKFGWDFIQNLSVGYDTESLMHYGRKYFAIDPLKDTMTPIDPTITTLGQNDGFSEKDLEKLLRLYCQETTAYGSKSLIDRFINFIKSIFNL